LWRKRASTPARNSGAAAATQSATGQERFSVVEKNG